VWISYLINFIIIFFKKKKKITRATTFFGLNVALPLDLCRV
jgi:hypothetical protein